MRQFSAMAAVMLLVAVPVSLEAATLSGIYVISSQSDGHNTPTSMGYWDTVGGNDTWNIWMNSGGIGGPFLNGPVDTDVGISLPMVPGSYVYTLQWPGADIGGQYFAMNLFFNDDGTTPRISVFAPVSTIAGGNQPFFVNSTDRTSTLYGGAAAASGTLAFVDAPTSVTLTDFKVFLPSVYGQDRISIFSTTPDGWQNGEFIAQFSLQVATVPEPSTLLLAVFGAVMLLMSRRVYAGWWAT